MINLGTSQLNELDEYVQNMGQTSEETGEEIKGFIEALANGEMNYAEVMEAVNKEQTDQMYDNVSEMVLASNLDNYMRYSIDENGSRYIDINIDGTILFNTGSAEIKEEYLPILSRIGDILKQFEKNRIEIIGHTDNVPIKTSKYPSNKELSAARAISVADYLADYKGMDLAMMSYSGRGEYDPVDTNTTEAGRARNRRIEIRIYNEVNSN